jgi:hypothetical protein
VDVLALLDAVEAAGLPGPMQDAVAEAFGDASEVALSAVKGLLMAAGVGASAAMRLARTLVSVLSGAC